MWFEWAKLQRNSAAEKHQSLNHKPDFTLNEFAIQGWQHKNWFCPTGTKCQNKNFIFFFKLPSYGWYVTCSLSVGSESCFAWIYTTLTYPWSFYFDCCSLLDETGLGEGSTAIFLFRLCRAPHFTSYKNVSTAV